MNSPIQPLQGEAGDVVAALQSATGDDLYAACDRAIALIQQQAVEKAEALKHFHEIYVGTDLVNIAMHSVKSWKGSAKTICRLRGEANADEDLRRFVNYVDRTEHMSVGEVSRILDFAQGQKARAETAEASASNLRDQVASLTEERDGLRAQVNALYSDDAKVQALADADEEIQTLQSQLAERDEALAPFVEAAMHLHPALPDDGTTLDGLLVADFRRAAALARSNTNVEKA